MSKKNNNYGNSHRLQNKNIRRFFGKLALISFVPVVIIAIALTVALKGQHEWVVWLVSAVLLIICFSVGYYILAKKERQKQEQEKANKGKAKNKDDIDIFG